MNRNEGGVDEGTEGRCGEGLGGEKEGKQQSDCKINK